MGKAKLDKTFPLMVPYITQRDIDAVTAVLRSGMLVQGQHVSSLEHKIQDFVSVKHAVAASNGTATLQLALLSLEIGIGDEVIVPAFSYIATANVVELVGATPIFVDIDPFTFNIDVEKISEAITAKTKAIIPVHEFGLACNISEILKIAKKNNIHVIEDAACALGAKEDDIFVGCFGTIASFSFHPRKNITSGEGGVITTNHSGIANKIKMLRNHGIDPDSSTMNFILPGFNCRMTDFQAALVNSQLDRINEIINKKQTLADVYLNELDSNILQLPRVPENKTHTWQTFHVLLDNTIPRDTLILKLKEKGIGTNYGAQCIPVTNFYQKKYGLDCNLKFPNALLSYNSGLALPMYYGLEESDVKYIAKEINNLIHGN